MEVAVVHPAASQAKPLKVRCIPKNIDKLVADILKDPAGVYGDEAEGVKSFTLGDVAMGVAAYAEKAHAVVDIDQKGSLDRKSIAKAIKKLVETKKVKRNSTARKETAGSSSMKAPCKIVTYRPLKLLGVKKKASARLRPYVVNVQSGFHSHRTQRWCDTSKRVLVFAESAVAAVNKPPVYDVTEVPLYVGGVRNSDAEMQFCNLYGLPLVASAVSTLAHWKRSKRSIYVADGSAEPMVL